MIEKINKEISKIIVGQKELTEELLTALLGGGHIILEGVPGLAKTTMINTLAKALGVEFKRIQFTPDLLPSDITGSEIYDPKKSEFRIKKGPVFTNLLLADEINRASAKVQSALLEVMQEKQVTLSDKTYKLQEPFLVMATQNPIEQEGTYNLPEAQLDRFMLKSIIKYPLFEEELMIIDRILEEKKEQIQQIVTRDELLAAREEVKNVFMEHHLKEYILKIIFQTRKHPLLSLGASPRGTLDLVRASKTKAFINKKEFVTPTDILNMTKPVLRHRIVLNYEARAKEITADNILDEIIEKIKIP